MLETAIADGSNQFGLQQKVAEAGRVDADIATLLVDVVAGSGVALLAVGGSGGLVAADFLVGVVDEILFVRHDGQMVERVERLGRASMRKVVLRKVVGTRRCMSCRVV